MPARSPTMQEETWQHSQTNSAIPASMTLHNVLRNSEVSGCHLHAVIGGPYEFFRLITFQVRRICFRRMGVGSVIEKTSCCYNAKPGTKTGFLPLNRAARMWRSEQVGICLFEDYADSANSSILSAPRSKHHQRLGQVFQPSMKHC